MNQQHVLTVGTDSAKAPQLRCPNMPEYRDHVIHQAPDDQLARLEAQRKSLERRLQKCAADRRATGKTVKPEEELLLRRRQIPPAIEASDDVASERPTE